VTRLAQIQQCRGTRVGVGEIEAKEKGCQRSPTALKAIS
jgi:hypothetical protein